MLGEVSDPLAVEKGEFVFLGQPPLLALPGHLGNLFLAIQPEPVDGGPHAVII